MAMTPKHIVVVEDDPGLQVFLADVLCDAGYHVTAVATLADALTELARGDVDLVLSDVLLPDGQADSTLHSYAPAPCLFTSGHPDIIEHLGGRGAHYLPKPFTRPQLLDAVRHCLEMDRSHPRAIKH
jgi:DNA-binding response OmpR family regulator